MNKLSQRTFGTLSQRSVDTPCYLVRSSLSGILPKDNRDVCARDFEKGTPKMHRLGLPVALTSAVLLSACVVAPPSGPSVMALPPQGKPFDRFQQEDAICRGYASQQSGGSEAAANAQNNAVGSAVLGTGVGAVLGALVGSASGNAGTGAAIGAGAGLLVGGSAGASGASHSVYGMQAQYDTAYTQCMYAHGNSVQSAPTGYAAYPPAYPAPYAYPYSPDYYGPGAGIGGYSGRGNYGRGYRRW